MTLYIPVTTIMGQDNIMFLHTILHVSQDRWYSMNLLLRAICSPGCRWSHIDFLLGHFRRN